MTTIDWKVVAIFDEGLDGETGFAYTDGLARHGLPELHIWARPTHGSDVGDRFALSTHDMGGILNAIGLRLRSGELRAGSCERHDMDGGLTTMAWELAGPVRAADVDAYRLAPEQRVLECHWRLERPMPRTIDVDRAVVDEAVRAIRSRSGGVAALLPASRASTGPFHEVIAELRAAARRLRPDRLVLVAAVSPELGALCGLAATLAHTARRDEALDAVQAVSQRDAARICGSGSTQDEMIAVEGVLRALYGVWVVADLVLLPGAEAWWEDPRAAERSEVVRSFVAVTEAALLADWAGAVISAHPAVSEAFERTLDAGQLHRGWRSLDWRSVDLAHDVITAVARAGHGWLDEARAVEHLVCARPRIRVTPEALVGLQLRVAAAVARWELLPEIDQRRLARLLRRLDSRRSAA